MTMEQASARSPASGFGRGRSGGGGFDPGTVNGFRMPVADVEELLGKLESFAREGGTVTAHLTAEAASDLLSAASRFGSRRGRGRGGRAGFREGRATFVIQDGLLTEFSVAVSGTREFRGNEEKQSRITRTDITDIASTAVTPHPDAREIIEALIAGRKPDVFVPEPGFRKLFKRP